MVPLDELVTNSRRTRDSTIYINLYKHIINLNKHKREKKKFQKKIKQFETLAPGGGQFFRCFLGSFHVDRKRWFFLSHPPNEWLHYQTLRTLVVINFHTGIWSLFLALKIHFLKLQSKMLNMSRIKNFLFPMTCEQVHPL